MARAIGGPYVQHEFGDKVLEQYKLHLGWVTAQVDTSIAWPLDDTLIHYGGDDYFLRGTRDDHSLQPCLTMRTSKIQPVNQALQKMYKFGSILGWYLDGFVDVRGHITSSHAVRYSQMGAPRGGVVMGGGQKLDCNYLPIVESDEVRRALAFWREGQRLYRIHDAYSFLSFYKVIDSQFTKAKGREKGAWISAAIPKLTRHAADRVRELQAQGLDVSTHILESGRHAIAHASIGEVIVDPDLVEDRERIFKDIDVMQGLAQLFIRDELGIPTRMDVYRERDRLIPLYKFIDPAKLEIAKASDAVPRRSLKLDGMQLSVNIWPEPPSESFKGLSLRVLSIRNGVARVTATNSDQSLSLVFYFDFLKGKAHAAVSENFALSPSRGGKRSLRDSYDGVASGRGRK